MHIWKTLKVFLSSTFLDLEQERDKLGEIFVRLKQEIASRRLSLILYDLRWREKHDEEILTRWCLEMLDQCQYFIGILGFRYGWRPPEDALGNSNTQRLSITEMEMRKAIHQIPQSRRIFFLGNMEQYKKEAIAKEKPGDIASVEALRDFLKKRGETVYEYGNTGELLQTIEQKLREIIACDYPPDSQAEFEQYTHTQALEEIIQQKIRGFVGRSTYLKKLQEFALSNTERNYLVILAIAGTGKSALLAKFISSWRTHHPKIPIVAHFASMGSDSREMHGMLRHLGEQMQNVGMISGELSSDPVELRSQIRNSLEKAEKPMVLAIDGLDEMEESARELTWLSKNIPNHVRLVMTTRPVPPWNILQTYQKVFSLDLPPLQEGEILEIIHTYDQSNSLNLSKGDKELLQKRASGNPLYLKVALEEIISGGIAVGQLANSIDSLFEQILKRLKEKYGDTMIEDYLGLIAASRSGLAENELHELLSESELQQIASENEKENLRAFLPEKEKLAGIADDVLVAATSSLDNFIVKRSGLLNFFHPEFERSIKERLGKGGMRKYHQRLASYFESKGNEYARGLFEVCYQQQRATEYEKLLRNLACLEFLQAKCNAGMVDDLLQDIERCLESIEVPLPESVRIEYASGVYVSRNTLRLLGKAIKLDLHFLRRHPECLFQSLWNHCYWYDAPESELYYDIPEQNELPPWKQEGDKIYPLMEIWRETKEKQNLLWLKSVRPPELHLDSPLLKILKGHDGWITAISVSPDGKKLVSGSHDQFLKIWDIETGECLQTLQGHADKITGVCYLPDGKRIVSCAEDTTARLWLAESGICSWIFAGHSGIVTGVAVDPTGKYLASSSKDRTIRVWDITSGDCIKILEGHANEVTTVAFSPDGKKLVTGSCDKTVRVWDWESGVCAMVLEGHARRLYGVLFSPDGKWIASAGRDDIACLWNAQTGERVQVLKGHEWGVLSISFSPDSKRLVTGAGDKTLSLWDVETGTRIKTLRWHERTVASTQFSLDGKLVFSGSYDKTIRIWNAESRECSLILKGHSEWARSATFSTDGEWIASGSTDKNICLWNGRNGTHVKSLTGHTGWVTALCFSTDAKMVASGGGDNTIRIWDVIRGECLKVLEGHKEPVLCLMLINQNRWLLSGSRDTKVRLWDVETGSCLKVFEGLTGWIPGIDLSPDGTKLLACSHDTTIRVWDIETAQCIQTIGNAVSDAPQEEHILSAAFSEDGKRIISCSRNHKHYFWSASTGKLLESRPGEMDVHEMAKPNTRFYAMSHDLETPIIYKENQKPIAFFPETIGSAKVSRNGMITGVSQGSYVYLLEIRGI